MFEHDLHIFGNFCSPPSEGSLSSLCHSPPFFLFFSAILDGKDLEWRNVRKTIMIPSVNHETDRLFPNRKRWSNEGFHLLNSISSPSKYTNLQAAKKKTKKKKQKQKQKNSFLRVFWQIYRTVPSYPSLLKATEKELQTEVHLLPVAWV